MTAVLDSPVRYALPVGGDSVPMNSRVGQTLRLRFLGEIRCIHCGRATRRSFHQGHCYACFTRLARCDSCIVMPERCHYRAGTCREPEWGEAHCLIPHSVYLANTSGVKVGITRGSDPTRRWIDQGASQALVIRRTPDRLRAGQVEVALREFVRDRTDWRALLAGPPAPAALPAERDRLLSLVREKSPPIDLPGEPVPDAEPLSIAYPVAAHPEKVVSHDLHRNPLLEGTLLGIKGQYLLLDTAVLNVRKFAGYCCAVE